MKILIEGIKRPTHNLPVFGCEFELGVVRPGGPVRLDYAPKLVQLLGNFDPKVPVDVRRAMHFEFRFPVPESEWPDDDADLESQGLLRYASINVYMTPGEVRKLADQFEDAAAELRDAAKEFEFDPGST
jgi:hypothetical protein